jgi:hypothetical protein
LLGGRINSGRVRAKPIHASTEIESPSSHFTF